MNPTIKNIECLSELQQRYVIAHSKGMAKYGWETVTIGWYSDNSRSMIVEDFNGTIYPATDIPSDNEIKQYFTSFSINS